MGYRQGSFEGNPCKRLLENIEFLIDEHGYTKNHILTAHIRALKSFNAVRNACFGCEYIEEDYEQKIHKFKDDYMVLVDNYAVSISVKAHEMFFHVAPWLKKWNIPLGVVSAHTEESLHSYFFKFAERKGLQNPKSPHFAENFRKVVVAENSTAI